MQIISNTTTINATLIIQTTLKVLFIYLHMITLLRNNKSYNNNNINTKCGKNNKTIINNNNIINITLTKEISNIIKFLNNKIFKFISCINKTITISLFIVILNNNSCIFQMFIMHNKDMINHNLFNNLLIHLHHPNNLFLSQVEKIKEWKPCVRDFLVLIQEKMDWF